MSVGASGRIVIEVPPRLKREIYNALSNRGITLKDWFVHQARIFLEGDTPSEAAPRLAVGPVFSLEHDEKLINNLEGNLDLDLELKADTEGSAAEILRAYTRLEARFHVKTLSDDVSYRSPVNFVESMEQPRHRWFPYKEGFSPGFVRDFILEFKGPKGGTILDPFSGVGTTALVAAGLGIQAVGFDVSPMANFIARTKAIQLDLNGRKQLADFVRDLAQLREGELSPAAPPQNATVISYFDKSLLEALLTIKALAKEHPNPQIADLGRLAFLALVERFSTHRRAGNGVKRKTRIDYGRQGLAPFEEVKQAFTTTMRTMHDDMEEAPLSFEPAFHDGSCIDLSSWVGIDSVSLALTSPPYPNCFDYSKIYLRELWLGDFFRSKDDHVQFREGSIRSHVHATWEDRNSSHGSGLVETLIRPYLRDQGLWSNRIPEMISGYFKDMGTLLRRIQPRMASGATFGMVVGNSAYGGLPIATDLILADIAENLGFEVVRIDVYRSFIPSSQQFVALPNMAWVRESMVILRKP